MANMKKHTIGIILKKVERATETTTLSSDATDRIDQNINSKMSVKDQEFRQMHVKSQMDAAKIYLTF